MAINPVVDVLAHSAQVICNISNNICFFQNSLYNVSCKLTRETKMDIRRVVLDKLEGMNLRYVARDSGVSYSGIYNLVTRRTASYETIYALYKYFTNKEKSQ